MGLIRDIEKVIEDLADLIIDLYNDIPMGRFSSNIHNPYTRGADFLSGILTDHLAKEYLRITEPQIPKKFLEDS